MELVVLVGSQVVLAVLVAIALARAVIALVLAVLAEWVIGTRLLACSAN